MKLERPTYQKPLSMTGLGGGATSLNFASAGGLTTDGLVFHVDAGNSSSYSGSGSQVNSLVGSISSVYYDTNITYTAASGSNPAYFKYPQTNYPTYTAGQVFRSSDFDLVTYPNHSVDMWVYFGTNGEVTWHSTFIMYKYPTSLTPGSIGDSTSSNYRLGVVAINASSQGSGGNPGVSWFHNYSGGGNTGTNYINDDVTVPNLGTGGWLQNRWHHFAFVNDASNGKKRFYIDGVRLNNTEYSSNNYTNYRNPTIYGGSDFYLYLGGSEGTLSEFSGRYSIYRFYKNKVLSDVEVSNNWNAERALFGR